MILQRRENAPGYNTVTSQMGARLTIGGRTIAADKFTAAVNASFHGDEFNLDLIHVDTPMTGRTETLSNGKIIHSAGGFNHEFYPKDVDTLKWDMVFNAGTTIPDTFRFRVSASQGLSFLKQVITPEEAALGCMYSVPEAEGSYAVYCNKRNNKYRTGKVAHIYSPYFVDEQGNKSPLLSMDITPDVDNAKILTLRVTPEVRAWITVRAGQILRLDPTLGYTSKGSLVSSIATFMRSWAYQSDGNGGALSTFHIYPWGTGNIKAAILNINQSTTNPSGLAVVGQAEFTGNVQGVENTVSVSGNLLANTLYGVANVFPSGAGIYYDTGKLDPTAYYKAAVYADCFADPSDASGWLTTEDFPWAMSLWVDYAPVTSTFLSNAPMGDCIGGGGLNNVF